jgi:hypothetical protein
VVVLSGAGAVAVDGTGAAGRSTGRLLRAGALLVPAGFALSAVRPSESDPGLPIALVPIGGLALLAGLFAVARRAWREPRARS